MRVAGRERGQALVEFALIVMIVLTLTIGVIDVGRGFYQYTAVAGAARYGARFGGVIGGTCSSPYTPSTAADWCNQGSYPNGPAPPSSGCSTPPSASTGVLTTVWLTDGNWPCQADDGTSCPKTYDRSFTGYYTVSDFTGAGQTSIVGAIATRFDTNSSSSPTSYVATGARTPGFNLSQMKVCIQLSWYQNQWETKPGSKVTVFVYYPFTAVGPLFDRAKFDLVASSEYTIE